jgi:hypothetical protein
MQKNNAFCSSYWIGMNFKRTTDKLKSTFRPEHELSLQQTNRSVNKFDCLSTQVQLIQRRFYLVVIALCQAWSCVDFHSSGERLLLPTYFLYCGARAALISTKMKAAIAIPKQIVT